MVWGSLILVTLAVARATRLTTADRIMLSFRRWVVNHFGEESLQSYLVHCSWCTSFWIALPAALIWTPLALPLRQWWLMPFAWFAMSYITGLLSRLEEQD
jgi:hypothetical protein